jgi:hypothetical protein
LGGVILIRWVLSKNFEKNLSLEGKYRIINKNRYKKEGG